ncbi:MAG TPA: hypothetical protein ENM97_01740 [Moorella mulderi]|nr:hypothetical protein [Moorella mulderi]
MALDLGKGVESLEVTQGRFISGQILWEEGDTVLLAQRPWGQGSLIYSAFSVGDWNKASPNIWSKIDCCPFNLFDWGTPFFP